MNFLLFVVLASLALMAGYHFYGNFLTRLIGLDDKNKTPAHTLNDGVDYVPAKKIYLLGQHFSAIAAAGPIVGPILAGMWFGWLPTVLWIIFGGIFIGGVHDMFTLTASMRRDGRSIAETIKETIGKRAFTLFLLFLWFSLVYIITTFTDITATTFVDPENGPAVASSSILYLALALVIGLVMRFTRISLGVVTALSIPLVFVCIFAGRFAPVTLPALAGLEGRVLWDLVLIGYCFIAAVIPVWLLLQPRGYLGGFFLSFTALISLAGIIIGNFIAPLKVQYPASLGWNGSQGLPILPLLFTTVACGACSGFHAMVGSGTTSKQIDKETDARAIGYGGLLLESFVAVIALGTLMILSASDARQLGSPNQIYAGGVATFLGFLGVPRDLALNFALLSFATFVYDTLDVSTRLGRYVLEELTGMKGRRSAVLASAVTLALPVIFVLRQVTDAAGNVIPAWKVFWPVFGSSNQLLAALVLFALSLWLMKQKKNMAVTLFPAIFMVIVAITSLLILLKPYLPWVSGRAYCMVEPLPLTGILLLGLALFLIAEGLRAIASSKKAREKKD